MAHSCPNCDSLCRCGGDIDDIQLNGTIYERNCTHCIHLDWDEEDDEDSFDECEDCGREIYSCVCNRMLNCTCGAWNLKTGSLVSDCCCGRG